MSFSFTLHHTVVTETACVTSLDKEKQNSKTQWNKEFMLACAHTRTLDSELTNNTLSLIRNQDKLDEQHGENPHTYAD
jgi:hypothetical protein